ncbi:hypothetical protein TREMEDRAFT_66216 [Tremella mesenterica DSM 1558]|uniref:uncharacterized protein n=1 Tax=Tremella mesenterica (strain ATCC 24925 / CBS 8224 / DSM 1558 / NBRC 9311 / NRRL Y-6157 / RJB 2259-6 / UBC 559-6) TaxID=578456 RepID=UPI00032C4BD8|nr:uncharacterized protein TREMEDRAFT_66216 [Tremella mesenterica DSM 1558]EIW65848.1 hypothetical protein TREMEDRAFT_66216 [Tremella mesenterica DSM 1558]
MVHPNRVQRQSYILNSFRNLSKDQMKKSLSSVSSDHRTKSYLEYRGVTDSDRSHLDYRGMSDSDRSHVKYRGRGMTNSDEERYSEQVIESPPSFQSRITHTSPSQSDTSIGLPQLSLSMKHTSSEEKETSGEVNRPLKKFRWSSLPSMTTEENLLFPIHKTHQMVQDETQPSQDNLGGWYDQDKLHLIQRGVGEWDREHENLHLPNDGSGVDKWEKRELVEMDLDCYIPQLEHVLSPGPSKVITTHNEGKGDEGKLNLDFDTNTNTKTNNWLGKTRMKTEPNNKNKSKSKKNLKKVGKRHSSLSSLYQPY